MKNHEIIKKIESSNSRKLKENVLLNEMQNNNAIFFEGLSLACNKLLTFGVKQIPESKTNGAGLEWENFKSLAHNLISRNLTGHAARDQINEYMNLSFQDEWNFYFISTDCRSFN